MQQRVPASDVSPSYEFSNNDCTHLGKKLFCFCSHLASCSRIFSMPFFLKLLPQFQGLGLLPRLLLLVLCAVQKISDPSCFRQVVTQLLAYSSDLLSLGLILLALSSSCEKLMDSGRLWQPQVFLTRRKIDASDEHFPGTTPLLRLYSIHR